MFVKTFPALRTCELIKCCGTTTKSTLLYLKITIGVFSSHWPIQSHFSTDKLVYCESISFSPRQTKTK